MRTLLAIGGINMADQASVFRSGVHMVVATPGRLKDLLSKGRITLDLCRWAADRVLISPDSHLAATSAWTRPIA